MNRSGSQKFLLVISIINIVVAALGIIGALLGMVGGAVVGGSPELAYEAQKTAVEAASAGVVIVVASILVLLACIFELIVGILGVRAANDNSKIMPVWVLAIISVALNAISFISVIIKMGSPNNLVSGLVSLVVSILILWAANNIKKEAGK